MDTFMALNGSDFSRLKFTTKMIKLIERLQFRSKSTSYQPIQDENIPSNEQMSTKTESNNIQQKEIVGTETDPIFSSYVIIDKNNRYDGIILDKVNFRMTAS